MPVTKSLLSLTAGLLIVAPVFAQAQSLQELQQLSPEDRRAYIEAMSEDERTAMRKQWRSEYQSLSDEEKQAMRSARRDRMASMSDEDRAAMREQRKAKKAERRAQWAEMSDAERAEAREQRNERKQQRKHRRGTQESDTEDSNAAQ